MYIKGRGKIGYLTGDTIEPSKTDSSYATWDAENSMIMAWLVNSMEEEDISSNYMCYPTAKVLWDNITQMYSDIGNQSQIYELQLKLGDIRQGENSITKYFNVLMGLWQDIDLFNDYEWKNPDDCSYFKKMVESSRIFKFLAGLNVEFDEVRGRIIGRQPLPSLGEVFSEVRREESRRNVMLGKKFSGPVENLALLGTVAAVSHYPNNQRRMDEKPRVWCDHCNKPRHTRETCWKLHGKPTDWKPVEWKTNKQGDSNRTPAKAHTIETSSLSKEQLDQLLQLLKPTPATPIISLAQSGFEFGNDDWQC